jgi:hypothetical protein
MTSANGLFLIHTENRALPARSEFCQRAVYLCRRCAICVAGTRGNRQRMRDLQRGARIYTRMRLYVGLNKRGLSDGSGAVIPAVIALLAPSRRPG